MLNKIKNRLFVKNSHLNLQKFTAKTANKTSGTDENTK